ncbi:MAG: carbohydrate ABC transporter permease [Lachnospiraceae bacterium]|nr:carbohydrate ABC transporter permease [Lachnospiraceae bacterium]MCI9013653.1 carbohydrate ABC transporter permease [Lachnospiraceae bacterium]MCI9253806.1 carbohydrate ABC transporter permease [Lachnospiraceae bacterium]
MTGVKVQKSRTDKIFDFFLYTISTIIVIVMLYPMYFIVIASFSNPADVSAGNIVLLPKGITFKGYQKLLEYSQLWVGYKNTILYAALGTVISLVVNVPTAYALSRKDLCGRKLFTVFYLIPMFFTGGLIPTYLIVKDFGLLDNFWVMVLPFSVITYYIIVARTFFNNSIPGDLWEAAQIDGCGNLGFFFQIVIPLSKAVLAVIALWTAVGQWNSYFNALIYLRNPDLQPLQLVLRNILISNQTISSMSTGAAAVEAKQMADLIKYAIIVVSSAPIMCMYPFVQKHFNQGVMLGSLKG